MTQYHHQTLGGAAFPEPLDADRHHEPDGIGQIPKLSSIVPIAGISEQHPDSSPDKVTGSRQSVLVEAQGLVHGDRNGAYGPPSEDFARTASMVNAMWAHKLREPLTPEDVGLFMICVKLSRQINKPKRDSMVDLAGYAECVQWILDERSQSEAASGQPSAL